MKHSIRWASWLRKPINTKGSNLQCFQIWWVQFRSHFCLTLHVRSRLENTSIDKIDRSESWTGNAVFQHRSSDQHCRSLSECSCARERGFCKEKYCDDAGFAFGSTVMADNEQKATQLMAEAEKKLNAGKSFFGSLFGWVIFDLAVRKSVTSSMYHDLLLTGF